MSVTTVIAALQTRHAAISGVTSAPTALPGSLNATALPLVLVVPGPGRHDTKRVGDTAHTRDYEVRVYVAPVAQGRTIDTGFQAACTLLDAFVADYGSTFQVGTVGKLAKNYADNGIVTLTWGEATYHGLVFTLPILEL